MLREYLISEAMAALGVPTTRALSLVATGDSVIRDMFYDGHPEADHGEAREILDEKGDERGAQRHDPDSGDPTSAGPFRTGGGRSGA